MDAQADLRLCCSHMTRTDFLVMRLKYCFCAGAQGLKNVFQIKERISYHLWVMNSSNARFDAMVIVEGHRDGKQDTYTMPC